VFTITAQPKAGIDPAAVEKAIYEEVDKVKTDAVTDEELEKAKNILLSGLPQHQDDQRPQQRHRHL